jgi:hypothetical protein
LSGAEVTVEQALGDVCEAVENGRDIQRALAACNKGYPVLSAVLFRAAVRWRFGASYDVREITRYIAAFREGVVVDYRWLILPREIEAFIRAELGGEARLLRDVAVETQNLSSGLQAIMRAVFSEAVGSQACRQGLTREMVRASGDHRTAAVASEMKLDSVFVGHPLSIDEFDSLVVWVEQAFEVVDV